MQWRVDYNCETDFGRKFQAKHFDSRQQAMEFIKQIQKDENENERITDIWLISTEWIQ